MTVLGIVAFAGEEAILQILVLVGLSGATMTVQTAALQSLAGDVAGPGRLASAISLLSFGARSMGALGALASGFLISGIGAPQTFLFAAAPLALGAFAVRLRAFPGAHTIERQALCRCARGAADDRSRPDRRGFCSG